MEINLFSLIGSQCTALDEGKKVYDLLFSELKEGRSVAMNFENVKLVYSPFLMGCLGELLNHFEKDRILERVSFKKLTQEQLKTINDFLERADKRDTEHSDYQSMKEFFEEDELGEI